MQHNANQLHTMRLAFLARAARIKRESPIAYAALRPLALAHAKHLRTLLHYAETRGAI